MLRALRRYWVLGALAALAAMAGTVLALALVPATYTARAVVAMAPEPDSDVDADLVRLALPAYPTVAESRSVVEAVAERYGADPDRIRDAVEVEIPPASNVVLMTVEWDDPTRAAQIANTLAGEVLAYTDRDPLLAGYRVGTATVPTEASWPPWGAALVLGALLSLAVGVLVAALAARRRPLVSSPADTARLVEEEEAPVPVLLAGASTSEAGVSFIADAIEARLRGRDGGKVSYVGMVAVGRHSAPSVVFAAQVAAALHRRGRRVLLSMGERERSLAGRQHLEAVLPATGRVRWGVPLEGALLFEPDAGGGRTAWDVDVVLTVADRLERVTETAVLESLAGVVTVVMPDAPVHRMRAVLKHIGDIGVAHLALVHWVRPSTGISSAARLMSSPFRVTSARDGAPAASAPEPGRGLPSPAETGPRP